MAIRSLSTNTSEILLGTLRKYLPVTGLALFSRILLEIWSVEAVDASQSVLLEWPVFVAILLLGFPSVHFAEKWGKISGEGGDSFRVGAGLRAFVAGLFLAVLLIGWDLIFVLPRDMNVTGLISLPFYTTGAFLVEVVQHTIPLVLWLGVVGRLILRGAHSNVVFWVGAFIVAALEPVTQLGGSFFAGYPQAFFAVGALIIYGINLIQLYAFRRNGFVAMFTLRLGMYFIWHIVWGSVRLFVLF